MPELIIIDITDNEKTLLDGSLNLKGIKGDGKIVVKNPSNRSKLWDLTCDLKEIVNTTFKSRELDVGILTPSQEFINEYKIRNLKESSLKVVEIFDTEREQSTKINDAFLYKNANNCSLKISLANPLDIPISNINLTREIPVFFQEIEIINSNIGVAGIKKEISGNFLSWDIISLEKSQKAELVIYCTVNVNDDDEKALGAMNISYLINNHKLTMLNPEIRGLTNSINRIDRNKGSKSGTQDCAIDFMNKSEFQVRLEEVKVMNKILSGTENVVSQTPNRLINPEQSWNYKFQVESIDLPQLSSVVDFTPLFIVIKRVIGELKKESTIYLVQKKYD